MTFIKPIQSADLLRAKSRCLFWLAHWSGGSIQYNWPE